MELVFFKKLGKRFVGICFEVPKGMVQVEKEVSDVFFHAAKIRLQLFSESQIPGVSKSGNDIGVFIEFIIAIC